MGHISNEDMLGAIDLSQIQIKKESTKTLFSTSIG